MDPFDAAAWAQLYADFVASTQSSLERWMLRYIHQPSQLDHIAAEISKYLNSIGQMACVQVESVWIDGTPRAEARTCVAPWQTCELGDTLVVVDRFLQIGGKLSVLNSRALLVQAKVTPSPLVLPGGTSTVKQRVLLEVSCSCAGVSLWKGTPAASAHIGHYYVQNGCQGLTGYATYLLVPKLAAGFTTGHPPFMCAWPVAFPGTSTQNRVEYLDTMKDLSNSPSYYGKLLTDPATCEWTRMVHDLLHGYQGVWMNGYGGQYRINRSKIYCFGSGSAGPAVVASRTGAQQATPSAQMTLANLGLVGLDDDRPGNDGGGPPRADHTPDGTSGPGMPVLRIGIVIHQQG